MGNIICWKPVDSFVGNFCAPTLMYPRSCPICGSQDGKVVLTFDDFQFYSDSRTVPKRARLTQKQCSSCFTLYLSPGYSEYGFKVLFAEAASSYGAAGDRAIEQVEWLRTRGLLQPGVRVLDIGCHEGWFLAALPSNIKKIGVDIDLTSVERARQRTAKQEVELIAGDIETVVLSGSVDLITMFHVLEHLPHPVNTLRKLRGIAHKETRLLVEVPLLQFGFTNDINGFFSVHHMTHFSRRSLENCLAIAGWRIIESCRPGGYNGYRVLAEPCEPAAEIAGDPNDNKLLNEYLVHWKHAIESVECKLACLGDVPCLAIWGGGVHTEFLYQVTSLFRICKDRVYIVVDSDPHKQGKTWRGIRIYPPSVVSEINWGSAMLLMSSYGSQESIARLAVSYGVPQGRVVKLYDWTKAY